MRAWAVCPPVHRLHAKWGRSWQSVQLREQWHIRPRHVPPVSQKTPQHCGLYMTSAKFVRQEVSRCSPRYEAPWLYISQFWLYNLQLRVYISQFRLYISQFWLYMSQFWLYLSQFWLYNLQLRVYISQFRLYISQFWLYMSQFWLYL